MDSNTDPDPTWISSSAVILLLSSIQVISTSIAIMVYYNQHPQVPRDFKYNWAYISLILGVVSLLMGILAYIHIYIHGLYSFWVLLFTYLNLIMTVIGIVVYQSNQVGPIIGWILAIVLTIIFTSYAGNYVIPLSPSEPYVAFTG